MNPSFLVSRLRILRRISLLRSVILTISFSIVCGVATSWNPIDDPNAERSIISDVIGVAGEYGLSHGGSLDPKATRLKTSDVDAEGIDIELHGGRHNDRKQKAVVSLICDKKMTGNEGFDKDNQVKSVVRRDDDDKDDDNDDGDDNGDKDGPRYVQDPNNALQFVSYGEVDEGKDRIDVLRLKWRTQYACEDFEGHGDEDTKKSGWGFFTWFILM